ncbi:MAG TPA: CvpA family protein [Terriglobales bacterium]|nr:CvpA family protein [Terriglobales bacterium]
MGVADWIILAFLVFSVATAAWEGFFHEAFGLAGLIVGYLVAAWQYRRLADWFEPILKQPWLGEVGSFLLIFFGVLIVAFLLGRLSRWLMKEAGLTAMDRTLGGLLGLVKGSLIVAIVLVAMAAFAPTSRWLQRSELAPYFLVAGRAVVWLAPAELRQRFNEGLDYLRNVRSAPNAPPAAPSK